MVHLAVASLGAFVILLQRIYSCKEGLQIRTIKPGQSWEQALFFVGGVFGSRLTKIAQARRQSSLLLVGTALVTSGLSLLIGAGRASFLWLAVVGRARA